MTSWAQLYRVQQAARATYDDRRKGQPCPACGRMVSHGSPWGKRCGAVLGCKFEQRPARVMGLFAQPDVEECE